MFQIDANKKQLNTKLNTINIENLLDTFVFEFFCFEKSEDEHDMDRQ